MTSPPRPFHRLAVRLDPDRLTDGQLLARFVGDRDEAAFAVLVRRHAGLVYGVCRRVLRNAADADDAFQATFLVLLRKADSLSRHPIVGGWLHAVAVRVAMKARGLSAKRQRKEATAAGRRPESGTPEAAEPLDWFDRELAALPERYREPVVLCLVQERTRADAAAVLGIPEGTLASRLAYAKKRLADRLTRRGLTAPAVFAVAVPTTLLDTTAALATGGATPELVNQLATGAMRTMLFTKLRIGLLAAVAGLVVAGGVLLAGPGEKRVPRRNAPVPEKKEPEWMVKFTKAYQLKDGEYVKRIAPPFVPERDEYLYRAWNKEKQTPEKEEKERAYLAENRLFFVLLMESDGKQLTRRTSVSVNGLRAEPKLRNGDNTMTVWDAVTWVTGREAPEVVIDPKSKDDPLFSKEERQAGSGSFTGWPTVSGDFVTRKGAPLDKLTPQLEKILREECEVDVRLTVKNEEQDVYVAGGKFKLTPPAWRGDAKNRVGLHMLDVYATEDGLNKEYDHIDREKGRAKADAVRSEGYHGTPVPFVRFLGDRVKTRMVWDAELPAEPKFMWHNHTVKNPTKEQEAEDKDPAKVLANVTAQTGLTFIKEKRKVPVLVLSVPEKK